MCTSAANRSRGDPHRASPRRDLYAEIDHARPVISPLHHLEDSRNGRVADAIAVGANRTERREARVGKVQVVESGDAHILRHSDTLGMALEQYAEGEAIVVAKHCIQVRSLRESPAEHLAPKAWTRKLKEWRYAWIALHRDRGQFLP